MLKRVLAFFAVVLLLPAVALPCTTFGLCRDGDIVLGYNNDWFSTSACLVVNKRNVTKKAFISLHGKTFEWTSRYGSVTADFNAIGVSSAGMNEAGLVIDWLAPGKIQYPEPDARPAIDEIQWIQYQLDTNRTVDEVLQSAKKVQIRPYYWHAHYFMYDRERNAAAIDFLDGKMVVTKIPRDGLQLMANRPYGESVEQYKSDLAHKPDYKEVAGKKSSPHRFYIAAGAVKACASDTGAATTVDLGFSILSQVANPHTLFSWVYDPVNLCIYYKTRSSPKTRKVSFDKFNFDNKTPMLLLDVNTPKTGDVSSQFTPYSRAMSRKLVTQTTTDWHTHNFSLHVTGDAVERLILYPETEKANR
jgi:penicillin V acylase-like amidase (Ntn superfamily)